MNTDGGRFHLLLGAADWGRCMSGPEAAPVKLVDLWADEAGSFGIKPPAWDEGRSELTLPLAMVTLPATPGEVPLAQTQRRAACADSNGNIYSIADDPTVLRVHSNGDGRTGVFWPDPRAVQKPRDLFRDADPLPATSQRYTALAVTDDAWLVAAFTDDSSRGLARFDLIGGGAPLTTLWPDDLDISVSSLAPRTGGGLWLLDGKIRRLYELDSQLVFIGTAPGEIIPELFQPVDGELRTSASAVSGAGRDLSALAPDIDPIGIAPLKGGAMAILSRHPARLYVLQPDGSLVPPLPLDFVPHDLVFANVTLRGEKTPKPRLLLSGGAGNQARGFRIDDGPGPIRAHATSELFPMRRYGGRALVSVKGVAHYDSGSQPHWTPFVERPRVRFDETITFLSPIFDGGTPDLVWDRLRLDGCIPPGTFVDVEARAADERDPEPHETVPAAWLAQPRPCLSLSGHELAGHSRIAMTATDARTGRGTWELLFQRIRGRYLQLRIRMSGDADASPRLRALRASYPRFSYTERFLPAIYREDSVSGDFVERFLANMQGINSVIEGRIAAAQALFDARTAPPEALAWLADWFDVALDPAWDEQRQRQFIARAATFFGWRGTLRGVESALSLAFDHKLDGTLFGDPAKRNRRRSGIRIVESFLTRRLGALVAGDPTAPPGLASIRTGARWEPAQGVARLVDVVAAALGRDPKSNEHNSPFPLFPAAGDDPARWRTAMQQVLGFVRLDRELRGTAAQP